MTVPGYQLEAPIGRGAMGIVHRARRIDGLDRVVALKRVPMTADPELAVRLRQEAQVLAALDHPHIVRVIELVEDGDGVAIAMQLAPGGSLEQRLDGGARLSAGEVASMAAKLADALASAHRRGVLHCDVKPANVLFTIDGEPLLSDFGLARWMARVSLWGGAVLGTAEYLDPAVADGARPDERSDVYALGVVCYEALAGRPPFSGATPLAVLRASERGRHEPLQEVVPSAPPALTEAVERAIDRAPAARFESASAFAEALRASLEVGSANRADVPAVAVEPAHPAEALLTADDSSPIRPTRRFGLRPTSPDAEAGPARPVRRGSPRVATAVAFGSVAVAIMAVVVTWPMLPGRAAAARRAAPSQPRPCRPGSTTTLPQGTTVFEATIDRRHCTVPVLWDGQVATVGSTRYSLGRAGDQFLVGDWNGDGTATPAVYRGSDGRVFLFASWAAPGPPVGPARTIESGIVGGQARVERTGHHDRVIVRPH